MKILVRDCILSAIVKILNFDKVFLTTLIVLVYFLNYFTSNNTLSYVFVYLIGFLIEIL